MNDNLEKRREQAADKHMLQNRVDRIFCIPCLFHDIGKSVRCVNLDFHHFMNHIFVLCALRRAKQQLEYVLVRISVVHHAPHSVARMLAHVLALLIRRKFAEFVLRFGEHAHRLGILLTGKRVKQFFLAFVISAERTCCHPRQSLQYCGAKPI